uniref:Signal-induced proliferation-associated 1 like 3 n=1 Tax=Cyprinus carpio TaxID=7962 RepID=A0A8C2ESL5_CYPCA
MYRDTGVCATPLSQPLPPPHLRLPLHNGHSSMGDPALSRVSVPKMGVRARIAEWPPRRALSRESLLENGQGSHPDDLNSEDVFTRGNVTRLPQGGTRDSDFLESTQTRSPGTPLTFRASGFAPLRHRSNSEITLSEQDETEVEGRLFREYGSTSSINVQAVSEQSFFDMLSQFQQERPDQRSTAPAKLGELLGASLEGPSSHGALSTPRPDDRPENRVRKKSGGTESSLGTSSLFRKLRSSSRGETETPRGDSDDPRLPETLSSKPWVCVRSFAHFDAQSILFDLHEAAARRSYAAQRRNTATGASAASSAAVSLAVSRAIALGGVEPSFSSTDDLSVRDLSEGSIPALEHSEQGGSASVNPNSQQQLLLSCPHFINETGSYRERNVSFLSSWAERGEAGIVEPRLRPRCSNASVSKLEVPPDVQATRLERLQQHCIEHVDLGARYYHEHFYGKEHWNYFGNDEKLGPVALSIRREKLDDTKDLKDQYQYRIIFRTNELVTLRGAILEDAILSTAKHGTLRGLPLKEVLEYVLPELSVSCLRMALSTPKVTEQLLKLDEQGLSQKHKVGILLCRAGQSTEEEMYNNEEATPAFTAFLELLGETVCLRGFNKYAAQLDTKTDSTGTHSLYTTYQDYEIMFHVSTMLPYMPNNPQQLLRKRHIGNDIVTIIFQEPGALPFTPQNIRSHFQHVFVIVRVHNPCSDNTCYSVAVTRMKDVPPFGPPLPSSGLTFRDPAAFRAFLLAKIINAENAAHKSEKFHAMATRTRQGYLRDLAENCVSTTPLDTAGKLNNLISLASKRKERIRAREAAEMGALGALVWRVLAQDFSGGGAEFPCALAISNEYIVLADCSTKEVIFNCFCADVIGWTAERLALKIFYGRGDHIALRVPEGSAQDIREVVQRLKALTVGCETVDMTLRRNGLGQLGFHVRLDGTVSEVEEYGFAWQAGLRQGSRLVEICKVAAVTLSHEQMIDLLRTSVTVKVVIIPPFEEGGARRGCTEEHEMKMMEQKGEVEPVAASYRAGQQTPVWRWDSPPGTHSSAQRWTPSGPPPVPSRTHKALVPIPYREPQHISAKRPVSYPENHYSVSPLGVDRGMPYRNPSASFSSPSSGFSSTALGVPGLSGPFRSLQPFDPHVTVDVSSGESSSGFTSQESTMERNKSEHVWHVPASSRGVSVGSTPRRQTRQEVAGKDSPNRPSKGEAHYSSHSSSNTLSSNASSSHSDERWFDSMGGGVSGALSDPSDPDPDHMGKGGSSDSGIDASLYTPSPNTKGAKPSRSLAGTPHKPLHGSATYSGLQELSGAGGRAAGEGRRRESSPVIASANQSRNYRTRTFPPPGSANVDNFKPRYCIYISVQKFGSQTHPPKMARSNTPPHVCVTMWEDLHNATQMFTQRKKSPHRTLQRTFSDESLCSGRRDSSYASTPLFEGQVPPSDLLFTCTLPTRRHGHNTNNLALMPSKKVPLSASELSLTEVRDKVPPLRRLDPGLMPLPDTACGLEWSSLVNAAKAYEGMRQFLSDTSDSQNYEYHLYLFLICAYCSEEVPNDLSGRLYHLEVMLKQLNSDLEKEKQDKAVLLAEMANLRQNNQRLQEESHSASEQLRKFSKILSSTMPERK